MCAIVQNFMLIGQTVAEILRFFDFFSIWRPSAILDLSCACLDTNNEYLVVFITVLGRPWPRGHFVRWGPNSRHKGAQQPPPLLGPCLLPPNDWMD